MVKLTELGVEEVIRGLREKEFSSVELIKDVLKKISEEKKLNAYVRFSPEKVLKLAKKSDERISKNKTFLMDGVHIAVIDIFCTKDEETNAS